MRALMIAAALAFTAAAPALHAQTSGTSPTPAQKTECKGPDGKDATNAKCKGAGPAPAASSIYKLDDKGVCRDADGKQVKKTHCKLPS